MKIFATEEEQVQLWGPNSTAEEVALHCSYWPAEKWAEYFKHLSVEQALGFTTPDWDNIAQDFMLSQRIKLERDLETGDYVMLVDE